MDEIEISEHLDYLQTIESTFNSSSPSVIPSWERKKHWKLWTPLMDEYHTVIDNPTKLPTLLQPLLSKERAFYIGGNSPSYLNFEIHVPDDYGIHRRLFINLCKENLIVGALGAVLVGVGTRHFNLSQSESRLHSFVAQRFLLGKPVSSTARMMLSGSSITATIGTKLALRAFTGGILYDMIKRSNEEKNMNRTDQLMNVGLAGSICGFLFGLKGGLPHAWAAALLTSAGTVTAELMKMKTQNQMTLGIPARYQSEVGLTSMLRRPKDRL